MPIPVTVLGGYLGAGKTTLVNRILAGSEGLRVVVVVNDFGEVNVDEALITSRSGDTIGLANGCVCCNLSEGMAAVIERIRAMRPPPDHVVIEVSGVGDPGPVAAWADHPGFDRNAVLVCADAETVRAKLDDRWVGDTVRAQLHAGDLILLTKTDLLGSQALDRTRAWLSAVVPAVPVVDAHALDLADLLNAPAGPRPALEALGHQHGRHRSWVLRSDRPVDPTALREAILAAPAGVVRVKGIVRTTEAPLQRTAVNAVGRHCEMTDAGPWGDTDGQSYLVVVASAELATGAEQEFLAGLLPR